MRNTADLTVVQKPIIDTLHKEGKSQRVITERSGCSRSAVSKHIKCKVDWKERNWVGKCAQATGMTKQQTDGIVSASHFRVWKCRHNNSV